MKKLSLLLLLTGFVLTGYAQNNPFASPENFIVDAKTSLATWSQPADSSATPVGYELSLDNTIVDTVAANLFSYSFTCLVYNQNYTATIKAIYSTGMSDAVSYTWASTYLRPIANPFINYTYGSNVVNFTFQPVPPCDSTTPFDLGLMSIDVYRDGNLIAGFDYDPNQGGTSIYFDANVLPGEHTYCAKAIWDLSEYGFPGQTDVSMATCSSMEVVYGYPLPFTEDWTSGTFSYNQWSNDGNWKTTAAENNMTASFPADGMVLQDYESALTSYYINADSILTGNINLSFDLKLDDNNSTGTEALSAQVYDGETWQTLAQYTNQGSFDWLSDSLIISQYVLGNVFQIRFLATGTHSENISGWYIDNINIREVDQTIGIQTHQNDVSLLLYPNPATNMVTISSSEAIHQITIFNFLGEQVFQQKVMAQTKVNVPISDVNSGMYLVQIITNSGMTTKKLVVK